MPQSYLENRILSVLPKAAMAEFAAHMEVVWLTRDDGLKILDPRQPCLYFPIDCIISLRIVMPDGFGAQIAIIGNDGIANVASLLGGYGPATRAQVHSPGCAFRVPVDFASAQFEREGAFHEYCLRYVQALMTQVAQTGACNRHHVIEEQVCRWLLMIFDRLPEREHAVTQEMIADMLGVRREGVTLAANKLRDCGAIEYSRGHLLLKNRRLLEQLSCECYQTVHVEFARLLGPWLPAHRHTSMPEPQLVG